MENSMNQVMYLVELTPEQMEEVKNPGAPPWEHKQGNVTWKHGDRVSVSDSTKKARNALLSFQDGILILTKNGKEVSFDLRGKPPQIKDDVYLKVYGQGHAIWTHGMRYTYVSDKLNPTVRAQIGIVGKYLVVTRRSSEGYFDIDGEEIILVKVKKLNNFNGS